MVPNLLKLSRGGGKSMSSSAAGRRVLGERWKVQSVWQLDCDRPCIWGTGEDGVGQIPGESDIWAGVLKS